MLDSCLDSLSSALMQLRLTRNRLRHVLVMTRNMISNRHSWQKKMLRVRKG